MLKHYDKIYNHRSIRLLKKQNITILTFLISLSLFSFNSYAENREISEISALKNELQNLQKTLKDLTEVVRIQQNQLEQLKERPQISEVASAQPNQISIPPATLTSKPSGSYLPNIGVIADIVGTSSESISDEEGNDRFAVREVEFVFSHDVDPYSTMNVVATMSDFEDPAIEEANITYFGLPEEVKAKIGRMRPRIGKASSTHRDALETVDEPLVIQRYLGIEGLYKTGLELSGFTALSRDEYSQELVAGMMEGGTGEDGDIFDQTRRYPMLYSRLANFWELSDLSSLEFGGTFLSGAQDEDSQFEVKAFGIDATYSHYFNAINKIKLQSEIYLQDRGESQSKDEEGNELSSKSSPYGFYTLADYRLAERWATGLRYDYVEPSNMSDSLPDSEIAYSAYLTFLQSEFARWRFQYQRYEPENEESDNRFFLQGTFAIGAHKHQLN